MDDFFSLFKAVRKLEALFLPFFPPGWRKMPPSYRIAAAAVDKLKRPEEDASWRSALIYSIRNGFFRAYHEMGLASEGQMSAAEMRWVRFMLFLIAFVVVLSFTPHAKTISPHIKGGLLLGSSTLLVYGSMRLSVSALWASWGLLFPTLGYIVVGNSPWLMLFLSIWVLIWHIPVLRKEGAWRWYDWLATLPMLFFWMMRIKWVPDWSLFQNGYLSVVLWCCLWLGLVHIKNSKRSLVTLQMFFPAGMVCLVAIFACYKTPLGASSFYQSYCFLLWPAGSILLSLGVSQIAPCLAKVRALYHFSTHVAVFAAFGLGAFVTGSEGELIQDIEVSQSYLHSSTWPLWWFIGAGIIMLIRRSAMLLFNWVQVILPLWLMPAFLFLFSVSVWYFEWFSALILGISEENFWAIVLVLLAVAIALAFFKNRSFLREWIFWGLYVLFLLDRYWVETFRLTTETDAGPGGIGFVLMALWLMWLCYHIVGENLSGLRRQGRDGVRAVVLMGAFLWLLCSSLWSIYIDENVLIQKEINLELFMGFNFFGVFIIIYNMIVKKYFQTETPHQFPWHWIILLGICTVQMFQCLEHYGVALLTGMSLSDLHGILHGVYVDLSMPLGDAVPGWVFSPAWTYSWRLVRWIAAMGILTLVIFRSYERAVPGTLIMTLTCMTSLAAGVTESYWFQWPGMASIWSVVFRPWQIDETVLGWNLDFLRLFVPYALAGLGWGWIVKAAGISGGSPASR